ncbi:7TM diverse intracellular signaling domain-containing protein, partial [Persicitalea sp.]|uniref:7TM diverse intracellular signaling domain-containing protein n=1 Tax=Persicitalea sp. TaxID=3100273 RepID=UPI0035944A49
MRKLLLAAILFLPVKSLLLAQSVPTIKVSDITADTTLLSLAAWRVTESRNLPTDTLAAGTFSRAVSDGIVGRDSVQWLRFDLLNDLTTPQRRIFQSPYHNDVVHFYYSEDNFKTWTHRQIGAYVSYHEVDYRFDNCRLPIDLLAGQRLSFLVKLENDYYPQSDANLWLQTDEGLKSDFWSMYSRNFNGVYLSVLILGAVLAIFLFVAFLYITTRDSLYLYYGLYLGGVALYFSTKTDSLFFLGYWVGGVPKFFTVLNEPVQMLYTAL